MDEIVDRLVRVIEEVAQGHYSNDIMEFTRPDQPETIRRIAEAVGMMMVKVEAREQRLGQLIEELKALNESVKQNAIQTVSAVAGALGARDSYTEGHAIRVSSYAARLAHRLGLTDPEVERIRVAGMLHDIGKIGFSDRVFTDEDVKGSPELLGEIRKHPTIGVEILAGLDFLGPVLDCVRYHHERLDGSGYPCGLVGSEIPLGAQIVSVSDCFDAMTTRRSYQDARGQEEVFEVLRRLAGSALNRNLVEFFILEIQENGLAA
jgi:putative nucleotidyltransferase with HDIG domain